MSGRHPAGPAGVRPPDTRPGARPYWVELEWADKDRPPDGRPPDRRPPPGPTQPPPPNPRKPPPKGAIMSTIDIDEAVTRSMDRDPYVAISIQAIGLGAHWEPAINRVVLGDRSRQFYIHLTQARARQLAAALINAAKAGSPDGRHAAHEED